MLAKFYKNDIKMRTDYKRAVDKGMDENGLLYEKILQYLREKIINKEFLPGDRLPTEMELAREFGVSRITSKRALEELRADGTIYRIRGKGSFVADLEHPKMTSDKAQSGMDFSKIVAFVIPFSCSNGGIMDTVKGASKIMTKKGYILDIKYSNNDLDEEKKLLLELYEKGVGGIIFYPISDRKNLEAMTILSMNKYPIVTIDRYYDGVPISYIVSDNQKGEYDATKYLLSLGHRNIAFISDTKIENATPVRDRYFGYCKALKESGIEIKSELVKNGDFNNLETNIMLQELLAEGATAFCCINDYVAIFVIQRLMSMGIDVPGRVSVIGFDNLDISEAAYPPLTTVAQDMEKMGECAARHIVDRIESGNSSYVKKILPVELVQRESCKERELVKESV